MAGVDSETESGRSQKEAMSFIIIRARPNFGDSSNRVEFWEQYRGFISRLYPDRRLPEAPDYFEDRIRSAFPDQLGYRFRSFLSEAYPLGAADPETITKRRRAFEAVRFSVEDIWYGSIDIKTAIEHLDQIIDAFGMTVDMVTAILSVNAPGALNSALGFEGLEWAITFPVVDIRSPPPRPAGVESEGARGLLSRFSGPAFAWKLLNALWILPIVVALFVLITTYQEMNRRISSYDKDLLKVQTDEIARVGARSDRFDEQHALMLQRQENILKESTDSIRSILADEVKRAGVRADYLDQQQVLLLQRYENLSKENSEIIKALIQKPDSCCKPCSCGCRGEKDRSKDTEGKCQNSADSK
jgi:hypothetical protein